MDLERKNVMFTQLIEMGFKEIEVGFPSASQPISTSYAHHRKRPDPEDVTIQVLTQCREDLIRRTYESVIGRAAPSSTSTTRSRPCSDESSSVSTRPHPKDRDGRRGVLSDLESMSPSTEFFYEYSPESFTGTELDYALESATRSSR